MERTYLDDYKRRKSSSNVADQPRHAPSVDRLDKLAMLEAQLSVFDNKLQGLVDLVRELHAQADQREDDLLADFNALKDQLTSSTTHINESLHQLKQQVAKQQQQPRESHKQDLSLELGCLREEVSSLQEAHKKLKKEHTEHFDVLQSKLKVQQLISSSRDKDTTNTQHCTEKIDDSLRALFENKTEVVLKQLQQDISELRRSTTTIRAVAPQQQLTDAQLANRTLEHHISEVEQAVHLLEANVYKKVDVSIDAVRMDLNNIRDMCMDLVQRNNHKQEAERLDAIEVRCHDIESRISRTITENSCGVAKFEENIHILERQLGQHKLHLQLQLTEKEARHKQQICQMQEQLSCTMHRDLESYNTQQQTKLTELYEKLQQCSEAQLHTKYEQWKADVTHMLVTEPKTVDSIANIVTTTLNSQIEDQHSDWVKLVECMDKCNINMGTLQDQHTQLDQKIEDLSNMYTTQHGTLQDQHTQLDQKIEDLSNMYTTQHLQDQQQQQGTYEDIQHRLSLVEQDTQQHTQAMDKLSQWATTCFQKVKGKLVSHTHDLKQVTIQVNQMFLELFQSQCCSQTLNKLLSELLVSKTSEVSALNDVIDGQIQKLNSRNKELLFKAQKGATETSAGRPPFEL